METIGQRKTKELRRVARGEVLLCLALGLLHFGCADDADTSVGGTTAEPAADGGGGPGRDRVNDREAAPARAKDAGAAQPSSAAGASARANDKPASDKPASDKPAATVPADAGKAADRPAFDAGVVSMAEEDAGEIEDDDAGSGTPALTPQLIKFSPMYSAFDGVHKFQLTPSVPRAADDAVDPLEPSSMKFTIDPEFFELDAFPDLTVAMLLTTKRAGVTRIEVSGKTRAGAAVRGEAIVYITQVGAAEWQAGQDRYNNGYPIPWTSGPCMGPDDPSSCRLPCATVMSFPPSTACAGCHAAESTWEHKIEYTPTQTAGYSNDQLLALFTEGTRPKGLPYNSALLRDAELPDCIFNLMHIWELTDDEKRGVIAQVRAVTPKAIEAIDKSRP